MEREARAAPHAAFGRSGVQHQLHPADPARIRPRMLQPLNANARLTREELRQREHGKAGCEAGQGALAVARAVARQRVEALQQRLGRQGGQQHQHQHLDLRGGGEAGGVGIAANSCGANARLAPETRVV